MRRPQPNPGDRMVRSRWAAVREPVLDTTGAVLLWAAMAVDLATRPLAAGQSASTPAAYLWAVLIAGPFAAHRRFPVTAIAVSDLGLLGYSLGRYSAFPGYATFALVFAVALHAGRRRAFAVYLAGVAGLRCPGAPAGGRGDRLVMGQHPAHRDGGLVGRGEPEVSPCPTPAGARPGPPPGRAAGRGSPPPDPTAGRGGTPGGRGGAAGIARDLHDVVAHAMSVIAVQAGAAHHVIDDRPEMARAALGSIEVTAREGLVEMRRMLGVLRSEDDPTASAPTTPAEGLGDIDRLLSHFRAAGSNSRSPIRSAPPTSRPHSTSRPTGSSRKASPTCSATADPCPAGHSTITHPAADRHPR